VFGVAVPLVMLRGVNGAALAAWEEIADVLLGTESVEGVKEGDSTLRLFLSLSELACGFSGSSSVSSWLIKKLGRGRR